MVTLLAGCIGNISLEEGLQKKKTTGRRTFFSTSHDANDAKTEFHQAEAQQAPPGRHVCHDHGGHHWRKPSFHQEIQQEARRLEKDRRTSASFCKVYSKLRKE